MWLNLALQRIIVVSLAVKYISYSRMESTRFITVIHALSYAVFLSVLSLASIGLQFQFRLAQN